MLPGIFHPASQHHCLTDYNYIPPPPQPQVNPADIMSDQSKAQPAHEHEGFFERILHHHMGQQTDEKMKDHHEDHDEQEDANSAHGQKKKEGEMDKLKDYYHKDEELEEEGETYGGLM